MGFIDESQIDPPGGRFIDESELDPPGGQSLDLLGEGASAGQKAARVAVGGFSRLLPFGDEIVGGGSALIDALFRGADLSDAYEQRHQEVQDYQQAFGDKSALAGGVVDIAGALAVPSPGLVAKATGFLPKVAAAGLEGAGYGALYGADKSDEGLENRLKGAGESAKSGAIWSAALSAPLIAAEKAAPWLMEKGKAERRASLKTVQSDYSKSADELGVWDIMEGEVQTRTQKSIDHVIESGVLGDSRKSSKVLANALVTEDALGKAAGGIIDAADVAKKTPIYPAFEDAQKFVLEKVPLNQRETYWRSLEKINNAFRKEGDGTLRELQNQKTAFGTLWEVGQQTKNGFNRAVYRDLQKTIEKAVPDVIPINRQLAELKTVKEILKRGTSAEAAANASKGFMQNIRTSGGVGAALIAGGVTGAPLLGAAGAGALLAAQTPKGKDLLGKGFQALSSSAQKSPAILDVLPKIVSSRTDGYRSGFSPGSSALEGNRLSSSEAPSVFQNAARGASNGPNIQTRPAEGEIPAPEDRLSRSTLQAHTSLPTSQIDTRGQAGSILQRIPSSPQNTPTAAPIQSPFDVLLDAVKHVESRGDTNAVSKAGAQGAYQLMPETGKEYHRKLGIQEPYNPFDEQQARLIAAAILQDYAGQLGGDFSKAVTAYHSGVKNVRDGKLGPEGLKYLPSVAQVFEQLMQNASTGKG